MARPRKTTEPLTEIIPFRLSKPERAQLNELAAREGLTVADLVRVHLLKARARSRRRATPEQLILIEHLNELGKVGSNLNQIARKLNSNQPVARQHLEQALDNLNGISDKIFEQLESLTGR